MKFLRAIMARPIPTQECQALPEAGQRQTFTTKHFLLRIGRAALFVLFGLTISTSAQSISFNPPVPHNAGANPYALTVGDFNGDGRIDMAAADISDDTLSVVMGNANGTFQTPSNYPVGSGGSSIATGDFDRDGKLDLTVANWNTTLRLISGNGDGTFQGPVSFADVLNPSTVLVGDVNGDGKLDILTLGGNASGGTYTILVGNGDGTFQSAASHAVALTPTSGTLSDLNRDGKLDLALGVNDGLFVLLGNGDATFQAPVLYGRTTRTNAISVGDFNNDGKPDLIVGLNNFVGIRNGNGDGTFQAIATFPIPNNVTDLEAGDFNDDGRLDIVATGVWLVHNVFVLQGNGNGSFQDAVSFDDIPSSSIAVGDFNRDGKPDLIVTAFESVDVLLNTTDVAAGFFGNAIGIPVNSISFSIARGDVNRDGNLDLVAVTNNLSVSVVLGNGDGSFLNAVQYAAGASNPESVALGDLNRDGNPDIIVGKGFGYVGVLLGNGDGTFSTAIDYLSFGGRSVMVSDFNRDGKPDVAVATTGISGESSSIAVLLGNGDGTLQSAMTTGVGESSPRSLVPGDFNRDGKLDLALANWNKNGSFIVILLGNGNGTFQSPINYAVSFLGFIGAGDLNGDGKLDLVIVSGSKLQVWPGNGDGTFSLATSMTISNSSLDYGAITDINSDGRLDLIIANGVGNKILTLQGNGNGSFQSPISYSVAVQVGPLVAGDLNHDGKPDLVMASITSNNLTKLINSSTAPANVSGRLLYINGVTPAKNVIVSLAGPAGSTPRTTTTDANGDYSFTSVPTGDDYTITLAKTGDVNGITAFDASLAARFAANIITLSANERTAADASNNGTVSAFDASLIARTAVNIANEGIAGTWKFSPASMTISNLSANQTNQNATAILVGDVSGNWAPARPFLARMMVPPSGITVSLPSNQDLPSGPTTIPITVGDVSGQGVFAYDFEVVFDPSVLSPEASPLDGDGTLSSGWSINSNTSRPGHLVVSAFNTTPLTGKGLLLNLKFDVVGTPKSQSPLTWQILKLNERDGVNNTVNGVFTVATPNAGTAKRSTAGRINRR